MRHTDGVSGQEEQMAGLAPAPPQGTAARRELGSLLKKLREAQGLSVDQVVAERRMVISRAKLFRLEAGKHAARVPDVVVLAQHYQASPAVLEELLTLAEGSSGEDWWHAYGPDAAPDWFSLYLSVEPRAQQIRTYEAELIPGLLQTKGYAAEVYRARNPDDTAGEVEGKVALRMQRQRILTRVQPARPRLHVVLNEAVVRRQVGGPDVMADQINQLRKAAKQPHITIDILPFAAGAHAAMESAFVILNFADPEADRPLVYIESPSSATYLHKPAELDRYETIFQQAKAQAIPIKEWTS